MKVSFFLDCCDGLWALFLLFVLALVIVIHSVPSVFYIMNVNLFSIISYQVMDSSLTIMILFSCICIIHLVFFLHSL